ncbi:MAG: hypothetical protein FJ024_05210, partial [Chloroflexi bacterium]|nr:hypothetical protein [Chloroflexota bacterium]
MDQKDLKDLERRIEKLKKLETKLEAMPIAGFEKEADAIKAKLKDPSAITEVERDIKELERKISDQSQESRPKAVVKGHSDDSPILAKEFKELEGRIAELMKLEKRLASLKLDGFEKEVKSLRAKLKNPMAVEAAEREFEALAAKVREHSQQPKASTAPAKAEVAVKIDREFRDLERNIARSKELGKRLEALPLEGFETEAESVRARLKDPTAIEKAEKELKLLETKIRKRKDQHPKTAVQAVEVENVVKINRELKGLERNIEKLRKLQKRLDSLELAGFVDEAKALRAKLKDPTAASDVERELGNMEARARQLIQAKSTADKLMASAMDLCNEASEVFHAKDYGKAKKLYASAIDEFTRAQRYVQNDTDLVDSINENIASAKSNVIACDIGLGSVRADVARQHYRTAKWPEAVREYQAALDYFEAARSEAHELNDESKLSDADKLVKLMNRNIEECRVAMDREKVAGLCRKIEMQLAEARELADMKHFKAALEILSKAESTCGEAISLAQDKGFTREVNDINAYITSIGRLNEKI